MFEYTFFRVFELLIIIALLYIVFRFLKADGKLLKKKMDNALKDEEQGKTETKVNEGEVKEKGT